MAVAPKGREAVQHWSEQNAPSERTMVWTEPTPRSITDLKVPVVYYLTKNGHLEQPHFVEVPISSPEGLYLRDVIKRLNLLRGKEMATMYSWSSKRSYKNGFVWHDLAKDDFIRPARGNEYVLKGSELLATQPLPSETAKSSHNDSAVLPNRKAPSRWNSFDLNEYKVYKNELTASDASTQTDDRLRRQPIINNTEKAEKKQNSTTVPVEIEISPAPSSSSPETLETIATCPSGRMRASTVLMQLISCGSLSAKDSPRISAMSAQYRRKEICSETPTMFPAVRPEDRDYFSGSLIETKKKAAARAGQEAELPGLKRSTSYNAGSRKLEFLEEEVDGVSARCIPTKPKMTARKDRNPQVLKNTEEEDPCRPAQKSHSQ